MNTSQGSGTINPGPEPGITVVVPVYNSEQSLPELAERLAQTLPACAKSYEVILVNDGSMDGSWKRICELASRHTWIRGICLMRNYGQHNALLCGIREARYSIIVTMDDDLQNPPEEMRRLVERLDADCDVVYGVPEQQQHGLLRNVASIITKVVLQGAMGAEVARKVSAFRAFRAHVCAAFWAYQGPFVSIDVLLTWGTRRFASIRVQHDARKMGTSNYTVTALVRHAFNLMTGFSVLPLQVASLLGFLLTLFGVGILGYVLACFFIRGSPVPGFTFLTSIISVFSGAQLFALGIIGEYLARMHFRLMDRPSYVVRNRTSDARLGV